MKWTHIYFDLDNTLYDHEKAFKKTILSCAENMLHKKKSSLSVHKWFAAFKSNCDQFWRLYEEGEWTRERYQIHRYCKTNELFDLTCSKQEAIDFQKEYQSKVASFAELYPESDSILSLLKKMGIELGIITNGGEETQTAKIEALKLFQWIPRENIYISEVIGLEKPGTSIFHYVLGSTGQYLYIGDTFEHDIKPALKAGFDVIYFNSRNEKVNQNDQVPEIVNFRELKKILFD